MVVLDESGNGISEAAIAHALRLVARFQHVVEKVNDQLGNSEFPVSLRIGIDTGLCVAINNGTGDEQEPMFLGSAANHAAKLAEGMEDGVFGSDHIRSKINAPELEELDRIIALNEDTILETLERNRPMVEGVFVPDNMDRFAAEILEQWHNDIRSKKVTIATNADFKFFHKSPPLSEIDFAELMPSHSARLPMASLFADISGYTDYIDSCIQAGDIANAVRALYVIRSEFQNVVQDDFDGRKIRFIGDCVHAVLACGNENETDREETVHSAIACAGGLRSSFNICLEEIGGLDELGLAIGTELGTTPITRLGIRGERSVRVASSVTTAAAEALQSGCGENQTKIGPEALKFAPLGMSDLFDANGASIDAIDYDDVAGGMPSPAIVSSRPVEVADDRAHAPTTAEQPRAHLKRL